VKIAAGVVRQALNFLPIPVNQQNLAFAAWLHLAPEKDPLPIRGEGAVLLRIAGARQKPCLTPGVV
jgi:hypothetical protein